MNERIIINFPTNFGDTVIGLPVLDRIRASYLQAKITAIVSPRTKDFLSQNSFVDKVVVFDKLWNIKQKTRFSLSLRGKYDLIVDLKNSFLPVILGAKRRTPFFRGFLKNVHAKDTYLRIAGRLIKNNEAQVPRSVFNLDAESKEKWDRLKMPPSIFIVCSSLSSLKCYPYEYLKKVIQSLIIDKFSVVILGEKQDEQLYRDLLDLPQVVNLAGKTTLADVFYLLKNYARLLLCVDSGVLHLGSYLNIPIVALFGPTNHVRFGPWSDRHMVIKNRDVECPRCDAGECRLNYRCMKINPQEVIEAINVLW